MQVVYMPTVREWATIVLFLRELCWAIRGGGKNPGRPTIGNNVEICAGSKIIGKVMVGDNVIIAPNSVVISDIPDNAVVSGVPAKVIKIREL